MPALQANLNRRTSIYKTKWSNTIIECQLVLRFCASRRTQSHNSDKHLQAPACLPTVGLQTRALPGAQLLPGPAIETPRTRKAILMLGTYFDEFLRCVQQKNQRWSLFVCTARQRFPEGFQYHFPCNDTGQRA